MPAFLLNYRGELAAVTAALIWAGSITAYSRLARSIPALSLNIFKNSLGLLCFALVLLILREPIPQWNGHAFWSLVVSGFFGLTLGDTLFFLALIRCGAQVATSMQCLGPVFAALLAMAVRHETLTTLQWVGVITTMFAILIVIQGKAIQNRSDKALAQPIPQHMTSGILFAVASALVNGMGIVMARSGFQHYSVMQGTTVRLSAATLGLVILLMVRRDKPYNFFTQTSGRHLAYLAIASFSGTFLGLIFLSLGIAYTKAGIASALSSTYPIWIVPLSWFVLKERFNTISLLGTFIAVVGMMCLFLT